MKTLSSWIRDLQYNSPVSFRAGGPGRKRRRWWTPRLEVLESRTLPTTFLPPTSYAVAAPRALAVADFNSDGNQDVAAASDNSQHVSVFLGLGDGTFQAAVTSPTESDNSSLAAAHLNSDSHVDLVMTNPKTHDVSVLVGNGNGTFQGPVRYVVSGEPNAIAVADFNHDGELDLAVANAANTVTSILLGNGDATYQPAVQYNTGTSHTVAAGDFNGDGNVDLALGHHDVVGNNNGSVGVLLGNGNGTFQSQTQYLAGTNPRFVIAADFNGDGRADVAAANLRSDNVSVLIANADGTLQGAVNYAVGTTPFGLTAADFDRDGKVDLAVVNQLSNNVCLLVGQGTGAFQAAVHFGAGSFPDSIAAADLDGDGSLDLVVGSGPNNTVSALLQPDDDQLPPSIVLSGSSGNQVDQAGQSFAWSVQDDSGLSALSVVVTRDAGSGPTEIFRSTALTPSGSFNFDAFGLGTFAIVVTATDNDADRPNDQLSATASRTVIVADDDPAAPRIQFTGSMGVEVDSQEQFFRWVIQDDNGAVNTPIAAMEVSITRDGQLIFHTSDTARAIDSFNFDSYGAGLYEITASVTESDNDWSGDQLSRAATQRVDVRSVNGILWLNRGDASDGIDAIFGANAAAARSVIDAAIASWNELVTNYNYGDGTNGFGLTVSMSPSNSLAGLSSNENTYLDTNGIPRIGSIFFGRGTDGHGAGWWLDPTPGDSWEFNNPTSPFGGMALVGSPAYGAVDLYSTALHEIGHSLGIAQLYFEAASARGRVSLVQLASSQSALTGTHVHTLLSHGGHVADYSPQNTYTDPGGVVHAGADDLMNPSRPVGERRTISNLDVLMLREAYGYSVTLPEPLGNFYANLNEATGTLTIKGISPFTGFVFGAEPSADTIQIQRNGTELLVSVDLGTDIRGIVRLPGSSPFEPYLSRFPLSSISNIVIQPGNGDDTVLLDAWTGTVTIDGQDGSDATSVHFGKLGGPLTVTDTGILGTDSLDVSATPAADYLKLKAGLAGWAPWDGVTDPHVAPIELQETVSFTGIEVWSARGLEGDDYFDDPESVNLTIYGGDGDDVFVISDTRGLVTVDGGDGSDSVTVMLGNLAGPVTVTDTGSTGTDTLTVTGTSGNDDITVNGDGLTATGGQTISFTNSLEGMAVDGGGGGDEIRVEDTPSVPISVTGIADLTIQGTTSNDNIVISSGANADEITVSLNGVNQGTYRPTGRVVVLGLAGNDNIQVAGGNNLSAWLYGGAGHDSLKGGGGHDVLLGGEGDDLIVGGNGRDVLIGGFGADRLVGNAEDDILIAGTTAFDADIDALGKILDEWTSSRDYAARTVNLMGTGNGQPFESRLNGSIFLKPDGESATVFDDASADVLTGSAGQDWFIFNADGDGVRDKATDLHVGEYFTDADLVYINGP
jgi:hypothetical protein